MARGAAAWLPERAQDRVARPVDVHDRHQPLDLGRVDEPRLHPLQRVGTFGPFVAAQLMLGLGQHHHAARREHDVVVQILTERLIEAARLLIDRRRRVLQIVRADDGGVAPGVAAAQPALFQHRHIGDAKVLAQIIRRRQPVPARAHDHHVIACGRFGRSPGAGPAGMLAQGLAGDGEYRIAFHPGAFLTRALPCGDGTGRDPSLGCKRHNAAETDIPVRLRLWVAALRRCRARSGADLAPLVLFSRRANG